MIQERKAHALSEMFVQFVTKNPEESADILFGIYREMLSEHPERIEEDFKDKMEKYPEEMDAILKDYDAFMEEMKEQEKNIHM